jgi:hypothetical protein
MIVKTCKVHGELTEKDAWFVKSQNTYRCRQCRRDFKRRDRYRITDEYFRELLKQQKGVCAICKNKESYFLPKTKSNRELCVDHCHETKKIRGLLCTQCNIALGKFKDSIEILNSAIEYLKLYE